MVKNLDDNDQQLALKKHSQFKAMELAIFWNSKYVSKSPNFKESFMW
jgi:hypothetical protein